MSHVIWIYGLSSSGKSAVSNMIISHFPSFHLIDNDKFRESFPNSFEKSMRLATGRKMAEEAKRIALTGQNVIANKITPYEEMREFNRNLFKDSPIQYHDIYCKCFLNVVLKRDKKGLYAKAIKGEIDHMIGVSLHKDDKFEEPVINPSLILDTMLPMYKTEQQVVEYLRQFKDI